jgi:peroxiredoxin Q/BCP
MTLEIGNKAPHFKAPIEDETIKTLADYTGKKLVLYFYPKDDTPGCTAEACDLRDNYHRFLNQGYDVLGVSPDAPKKHVKFIEKYDLPFHLLADEDHSVAEAYGVWVEKNMYGRKYMGIARTTFIINEDGEIEDIIKKVKTKEHTGQILTQ